MFNAKLVLRCSTVLVLAVAVVTAGQSRKSEVVAQVEHGGTPLSATTSLSGYMVAVG